MASPNPDGSGEARADSPTREFESRNHLESGHNLGGRNRALHFFKNPNYLQSLFVFPFAKAVCSSG